MTVCWVFVEVEDKIGLAWLKGILVGLRTGILGDHLMDILEDHLMDILGDHLMGIQRLLQRRSDPKPFNTNGQSYYKLQRLLLDFFWMTLLLYFFWDWWWGWQMISSCSESISVSYISNRVSFAVIANVRVRSVHHLFLVIGA